MGTLPQMTPAGVKLTKNKTKQAKTEAYPGPWSSEPLDWTFVVIGKQIKVDCLRDLCSWIPSKPPLRSQSQASLFWVLGVSE